MGPSPTPKRNKPRGGSRPPGQEGGCLQGLGHQGASLIGWGLFGDLPGLPGKPVFFAFLSSLPNPDISSSFGSGGSWKVSCASPFPRCSPVGRCRSCWATPCRCGEQSSSPDPGRSHPDLVGGLRSSASSSGPPGGLVSQGASPSSAEPLLSAHDPGSQGRKHFCPTP